MAVQSSKKVKINQLKNHPAQLTVQMDITKTKGLEFSRPFYLDALVSMEDIGTW